MQTIINNEHKRSYETDGYFTVPSFLDENEISYLLNKLGTKNVNRDGFYTSTCIDDKEYREYCDKVIQEIVHPEKIATILQGYSIFYANFINKTPNSNSEVVLHTDWSIMDETKYSSFKIWIPLVDVNKNNGTFSLVAGTHKYTNKHRGFGAKEYYTDYYKEIIDSCLTYLDYKAGQALFYHPGLLHYSPPNSSNLNRPAMLVSLSPANVQPVLFYRNWYNYFNTMSVYKFLPEFMNIWDKKSKPQALEYIGRVQEKNKKMPKETFVNMFKVDKK